MCTVTFVPAAGRIFLCSSRDEKTTRPSAIPPRAHTWKNTKLFFPQDAQAGGTWIATKENGDAGVLLNGAFMAHQHEPPYAKSRGLVFLDILAAENTVAAFEAADLKGIEPFTLVLYCSTQLFECRWDGKISHRSELNPAEAHIWSSATLYEQATREERKNWFREWKNTSSPIEKEQVMAFHLSGGAGINAANTILMHRDNGMRTVSITCISIHAKEISMEYLDLKTGQRESLFLPTPYLQLNKEFIG